LKKRSEVPVLATDMLSLRLLSA